MNIKDVAALAETSVATVSRVINHEDNVSDETRKRVLEVIEANDYKPNLAGRALRSKRSGKILVLIPSISNPFYSRVLQGVEQRASARGYDTLICITHRSPDREVHYMDMVRTKQIDGAIGFTSSLTVERLNRFAAKYPYVQCGAALRSANITYTCIDNVAAAEDAVEYFIRSGHTKIAFINGQFGRPYETERELGYRNALERNGIPFREEYLCDCDYNYTGGYDCCKKLMSLQEPPTAIFTSCDQTAAGTTKYLLENGKIPGKDVDVIGFDGTYLSNMCTPTISTVDQPGYDMGKTAFDLLYERITDPSTVIKRVLMAHTLSLKDTTRPKLK